MNNAGIVSGTPLLETSDGKILKTFQVNVFCHLRFLERREEKHSLTQLMFQISKIFFLPEPKR